MQIKCFGSSRVQDQLPRISEGLIELGCGILNDNSSPYDCDLVYVNDPAHIDEAWGWYGPCSKPIKTIFNIQDIPHHIENYDLNGLRRKLEWADHITTISKTTQKDVKELLGFNSTIIYQPSQNINEIQDYPDLVGADYKYLIVGRAADPNKRNSLAFKYLQQYDSKAKVAVIGSEPLGFGDWFSVLPVDILNQFYNSVDFVFALTKYGGIELSQIEAILAGKFPIVCNDSAVAMEFNPEFACDPTPEGIHKKIIEISENEAKYREIVKRKQEDFKVKFSKVEVARKILELV